MSIIPNWNSHGLIPAFQDNNNPTRAERSPYVVSLTDVILRFASSLKRIEILKGFLQYRQELHTAGIIAGFQWLDGSFLEDAERIRSVPPHDIDVTTFFELPSGKTEEYFVKNHPFLFESIELKKLYHTDGYTVCLNPNNLTFCIQQSHYWYSVWSHQRETFRWKGFVQIDLAPHDDDVALKNLQERETTL